MSLRLRAQRFVPGLDRVGARREPAEAKGAVGSGDSEERMIDHADVRLHPWMDVALERHHHFLRRELMRVLHTWKRLPGVEFLVRRRDRVYVV
jgi:hypothetical protein